METGALLTVAGLVASFIFFLASIPLQYRYTKSQERKSEESLRELQKVLDHLKQRYNEDPQAFLYQCLRRIVECVIFSIAASGALIVAAIVLSLATVLTVTDQAHSAVIFAFQIFSLCFIFMARKAAKNAVRLRNELVSASAAVQLAAKGDHDTQVAPEPDMTWPSKMFSLFRKES